MRKWHKTECCGVFVINPLGSPKLKLDERFGLLTGQLKITSDFPLAHCELEGLPHNFLTVSQNLRGCIRSA